MGGQAEDHEQHTSEVEEGTDGSTGAGAPVIQPALIYTKLGDVAEVGERVVGAVDGFRVPNVFFRKGAREQSYMYSLGV